MDNAQYSLSKLRSVQICSRKNKQTWIFGTVCGVLFAGPFKIIYKLKTNNIPACFVPLSARIIAIPTHCRSLSLRLLMWQAVWCNTAVFQNVSPLFTLFFLPSYFNFKLGVQKKTNWPTKFTDYKTYVRTWRCYCNLKPLCRLRKFCCLCLQSILNLFLLKRTWHCNKIIFPLNIRFFKNTSLL